MFLNTMPSEWKLPLNLAIGLHLFVLFSAMVLPGLIPRKPTPQEFTTIDLVGIAEPSAKNEPAAPAAKKTAKQEVKQETAPPAPPKPTETIKPEVVKQIPPPIEKSVPVSVPEPAVTPEPAAPPVPVEAISIKPLKQKLKKETKEIPDTRAEDAKIRKEELKKITQKLQEEAKKESTAQETIKRQRQLAAAREEARRAELEARIASADARDAVRDQIRTSSSGSAGASSAASSQAGAGNAQSMGVLEQQYYATIMAHVQQHWQPPDVKTWEPNLLAIVSITIASDGQIVSQDFEQESGDRLFDQFVLKTLDASNPLPPPPPALQKQRLEVGLRFKPSGIQ